MRTSFHILHPPGQHLSFAPCLCLLNLHCCALRTPFRKSKFQNHCSTMHIRSTSASADPTLCCLAARGHRLTHQTFPCCWAGGGVLSTCSGLSGLNGLPSLLCMVPALSPPFALATAGIRPYGLASAPTIDEEKWEEETQAPAGTGS